MKKNIIAGIVASVVSFAIFLSFGFKDANDAKVPKTYTHGHQGFVVLPAKQSNFVVVSDYNKAKEYLDKGYVLEDVDIVRSKQFSDAKTLKYYTLIKYAN